MKIRKKDEYLRREIHKMMNVFTFINTIDFSDVLG